MHKENYKNKILSLHDFGVNNFFYIKPLFCV